MDRAVSFELFPQKNKAENRCVYENKIGRNSEITS